MQNSDEYAKTFKVTVLFDNLGNESTSTQTILKLNDFGPKTKNPCALIIPGIEGMAGNNFFNLAKNLKMPAFALQLNIASIQPDIKSIADEIFQSAQRLCNQYDSFFLIGYSFGGLIALELAKRFEKICMKGHLILLDSAPLFCQEAVKEQILNIDPIYSNILDNKDELLVISTIMEVVSSSESLKLQQDIVACSSWEECLDTLEDYVDNQLPYSNLYMRNFCNAIANRVTIIKNMNLKEFTLLNAPISLIRPKKAILTNIVEDYGLPNYTEKKIALSYVEGDHISMINSNELSETIMKIYNSAYTKKPSYTFY